MGWLLALMALALGVVVIIAGVRGTQDELFKALTGRGIKGSGAGTSGGAGAGPPAAPMTQAQKDQAVQDFLQRGATVPG